MPNAKPNILFIHVESLDARALACMGEVAAHTPNLDRLAAQGTLYRNFYCNSPQCAPSRSSMFAGKYCYEVGAWNNYCGLPYTQRTWDQDLTAADYRVDLHGKLDIRHGAHTLGARLSIWTRAVGDPQMYRKPGPRLFLHEDKAERVREKDWRITDQALNTLDDVAKGDDPFCLYVGYQHTHPGAGYTTSPFYRDMIDRDKVTLPPREAEPEHPAMTYMRINKGCEQTFTDEQIIDFRWHYLAMIAELDRMVGYLLDKLDALGIADNTYIIFNADHGDMRMEHGQYLKNSMYESAAHVPMILAGPGVEKGTVNESLTSLIDIYPTLLDMAVADTQTQLSGQSLLDASADRPDFVFSEYHSNFQQTGSYMIRKGDWKLIHYVGLPPQLFNLAADPDELHNRAADPQAKPILDDLTQLLQNQLNPEAVDAAAKALDKAQFNAWRIGLREDEYQSTMEKVASQWDDAIAQKINQWASS